MLFRARGTNKDTNAPMVLDLEAVSRGAAEIKAQARGMIVTDVEDITAAAMSRPMSTHRGEGPAEGTTPDSGGMRNLIIVSALLVALAVIGYFTLPIVLQKNVVVPATTTQPAE
jgi:hypothetical protein